MPMKLADFMAKHGLSFSDMKDRLGCSEGAVRKWVYNERRPSSYWMSRIATATDGEVQPNDFFSSASPLREGPAAIGGASS